MNTVSKAVFSRARHAARERRAAAARAQPKAFQEVGGGSGAGPEDVVSELSIKLLEEVPKLVEKPNPGMPRARLSRCHRASAHPGQ